MRNILIATAVSFAALSMNVAAQSATNDHAAAKPAPGANHDGHLRPHDQHAGKSDHRAAATQGHVSEVGKPGDPAKVTRVIKVDMNDAMRFNPRHIAVKRGETVRFVVTNSGQLKHEMVLGSIRALAAHAEMMRKMPGMEHADENMVAVAPGKTGELIWQFTKAGKFDFACLEPGHFEAGMMGILAVK